MLPNIGFTEYQCGVLELSEASSHTVIELTDHVLAAQIALDAIEASGIERASIWRSNYCWMMDVKL